MPQFVYSDYRNPYASSIGDLILRQGDIAAQQAHAVGAAQARAAEISGQAAASAAGSIGSAVAGTIQQVTDPRRQLEAEQLTRMQRDNRSRNIFEGELKNPANFNPDGTINDAALTERLRKQDVGAWQQWATISAANQKNALELKLKAAEINKTTLETADKQRQFLQAQSEYLGRLAFSATRVLDQKPEDPLHARDTALATVARAAADGAIGERDAKDFLLRTGSLGPAELRQGFESFVPPELRSKLEKEAADTAKSQAEAEKATADAALARSKAGPLDPARYQAQIDAAIPPAEAKNAPLRTRTIAGVQNARTVDEADKVIDEMRRQLGQIDVARDTVPFKIEVGVGTQNEKDKAAAAGVTQDAIDQAAVKYAQTGEMGGLGMGNAVLRRQIMNRAAELYPANSLAGNAAAFKANQASLTTLQKQRDAIAAFEQTAQKNIDVFLRAAEKVVDTGSPMANSIARLVSGKMLGAAEPAVYDASRQVAINEIAKITSNPTLSGQLSDSARHEVEAFNPANATLKQTVAVMRVLVQDMRNRTGALDETIADVKGRLTPTKTDATTPSGRGAPPKATLRFNPATGKLEPM